MRERERERIEGGCEGACEGIKENRCAGYGVESKLLGHCRGNAVAVSTKRGCWAVPRRSSN